MNRIGTKQQQLDAQALLLQAQSSRSAPAALERRLEGLVAAHSAEAPRARAQHRAAVLREVDAHKGQLSPAARAKLEGLLVELKTVDLDTLRQAMAGPPESPRSALIARALKLMHDPANDGVERLRPAFVGYAGEKVSTIVSDPVPRERTREAERAQHRVTIGPKGHLRAADGTVPEDGLHRLLLRDDGQWYAVRPSSYGLGEFALGEDKAIGSIGVRLEKGKITGFEQSFSPSSGAQYENSLDGLALLFLKLEDQGVKVGSLELRSLPMWSWDWGSQKVDSFLRFCASLEVRDNELVREVRSLTQGYLDRIGSDVGKTRSSIPDPGVDRGVLTHSLRMGPMKDWTLVNGLRAEEAGRATVPTELGPLLVDTTGKKLRIVQGSKLRAPTDEEATALATVLGAAIGLSREDQGLVLSLVKSLEAARGPLYLPSEVKELRNGEPPQGLLAAEAVDPSDRYASIKGLLPEQGPQQNAHSFASGVFFSGHQTTGLGALSPDGRSQYLSFQPYSYETTNLRLLCQIASATGRTIHTTIRGFPIYAEPNDEAWKPEARLRSFNESMGWTRYDSEADHRKQLASYREKAIPRGQVVETAKSLGSRYGDYGLAGMAQISHPDNIMELLLHLRAELPPEALRDQVCYAVGHAQVPRGSEQAWLDTLRRVLLG